jgi:hypothetical protein
MSLTSSSWNFDWCVRMSCGEKMSLTNDQRSRSHIKGKVFKNVKMSPKKRAVLENVYRP